MILFSYFTDFSYFPLKIVFRKLLDTARTGQNCVPKVAGHGQNRSKLTILKGSKDGFSYFSLISIILFSNQGHPCICVRGFCHCLWFSNQGHPCIYVLGVFVTVYDFLIRVIPVYVLGVFATVYDFLIRVIPVYVLGVFATVYDFLIRVIPVYVLGVFASLWFSNQGHPCILVWWCGIFYFLFYHIFRFEISKAKQKLCVLPIAWSSKLGSVGRD
jgi:hypothetical protein